MNPLHQQIAGGPVLAGAQGQVPETVREHYGTLEHHAGERVACEKRCPFEVSIIANMKRAKTIFGMRLPRGAVWIR